MMPLSKYITGRPHKVDRARRRRRKVKARRSCVGLVRDLDVRCRYLWTKVCQLGNGYVQFEHPELPSFGCCDENPPRSKGGDPTDPQVTLLSCKGCHDEKHANRFHVHYLSSAGARGPITICAGPKKRCPKLLWMET